MKKTANIKKKKLIIDLANVENLYGDQDLASTTLFAGGFINFGYWENLKIEPKISKHTRALSSRRLYEKIFEILDINNTDAVLEVGCGLGNGCIILHQEYKPKYVIGVDASFEQIQRASKKHKKYIHEFRDSIKFITESAENLNFPKESMSKIYSVEALQHFKSLDSFLKSTFSILHKNGKLVLTTFFFQKKPPSGFADLFPNFACGVDKVIMLDDFIDKIKKCGFVNVKIQNIGIHVWEGFDRWIDQTEYKDTWDKNWFQAYKNGVIDYYIVEATKM